ncbi:hypothetical protein [Antrihabitans sp. YC2-6]|uniref:hypothetical protein n=1 Tax=Antrihabitans sp. YC2-6 TaxID=2799498 RepID=UPI0018F2C45A|nr:hypothetical protein [Antrihabitans sp. YC2-6]MBJ8346901.1 hypothetical protein [Antrihabitans sp. YC2-6]
MSSWFNYTAVWQIIVAGLLVGAGLPALFAVAVRLNAEGSGVATGHGGAAVSTRNPVFVAVSWLIFGVVLLAVVAGVLFIARDFIGHQTGLYLFGAKPK